MMSKTHISIGIATAFWVMQPNSLSEFAMAAIGGSIGGIVADIDVDIKRNEKSIDALYGQLIAIGISIIAVVLDYFFGGTIINSYLNGNAKSIVATIVFLIFMLIGKNSKHRDKTHSILAAVLTSSCVLIINQYIGISYFFAFCSHLIIDLLNKKPILLFYPLKKGLCFKLCYADGLGNRIFMWLGVLFAGFYVFYCMWGIELIN